MLRFKFLSSFVLDSLINTTIIWYNENNSQTAFNSKTNLNQII